MVCASVNEAFIAAIGFPVIILLLVPLRTVVISRLPFTPEELSILDQATASAFVSLPTYRLIHFEYQSCELGRRWNLLEACIMDDIECLKKLVFARTVFVYIYVHFCIIYCTLYLDRTLYRY